MVDRVSDADRLKAIELVNDLDSKLFDYVKENKDRLHLNSQLYEKLGAAGLDPSYSRHWELVAESLEGRLNNSLAKMPKISPAFPDFKRVYFNEYKRVKEEFIGLFKEYRFNNEEFRIAPNGYPGLEGFPIIEMSHKGLSLYQIQNTFLTYIGVGKKLIFGGFNVMSTYKYYDTFENNMKLVYEDCYCSDKPAIVKQFFEEFSLFREIPDLIREAKEIWYRDSEKIIQWHQKNQIEADQIRKEKMEGMLK